MLDKIRKLFGSDEGGSDGSNGRGAGDGEPEMISCDEALERLFEYLDGELEDPTAEKVAQHFEVCRRCYPRLNFEKAFRNALKGVREGEQAPSGVRDKVLELLQDQGLDAP